MTRSCFDRKARHEPFFSILLVLLCYKLLMTLRLGDTGGIVKLG